MGAAGQSQKAKNTQTPYKSVGGRIFGNHAPTISCKIYGLLLSKQEKTIRAMDLYSHKCYACAVIFKKKEASFKKVKARSTFYFSETPYATYASYDTCGGVCLL